MIKTNLLLNANTDAQKLYMKKKIVLQHEERKCLNKLQLFS